MKYNLLIFALFSFVLLYAFFLSPKNIKKILHKKKNLNLRSKIIKAKNPQRKSFVGRYFSDTKTALEIMEKEYLLPSFIFISFMFSFTGIIVSLFLENYFLLVILGATLFLVPYLFLIHLKNKYLKTLSRMLEGILSIITNSYLRTENIIVSIEENLEYIDEPIKKKFEKFLLESKYVNSNLISVLEKFKILIPNEVFKEWVDGIILCQDDITKKYLLRGIIAKLSEQKEVMIEEEVAFYEPLKEFLVMSILIIVNIPLVRVMNREWFDILVFSLPGKFIIAISFLFIFIGFFSLTYNLRRVRSE